MRLLRTLCFWLLAVLDMTVALVTLGILIAPALSPTVPPTTGPFSSYYAWLAAEVVVVAGAFALWARGRTGLAIGLLLILDIPAVYGIIVVGLMLLLFGVAGIPVPPHPPL